MSYSIMVRGHTITYDSASEFLAAIPRGMNFQPSQSEVVGYYLCGKIHGKLSLAEECFVQTCDVYGEEEPWEIWERLAVGNNSVGDAGLHLFTKLKKSGVDGSLLRTVGVNGGTWDEEEEDVSNEPSQLLEFEGNVVPWRRRSFLYQNPRCPLHHGRWTLLEYSCGFSDDLVLVALKNDDPPTSAVSAMEFTKPKRRNKRKVVRKGHDGKQQEDSDESKISGPESADQSKNSGV